jgi:hypothetical protein
LLKEKEQANHPNGYIGTRDQRVGRRAVEPKLHRRSGGKHAKEHVQQNEALHTGEKCAKKDDGRVGGFASLLFFYLQANKRAFF